MDLSNFVAHYTKPINSIQSEDKLMPKFPSYLCCIGSSGCGKSSAILTMILEGAIPWTKIYLNTAMLDEPLYEAFIKHLLQIEEETGTEIIYPNNKIEEIIPIDELDPNEQNIVIFDDFCNEKNQKLIEDYYQRGRKKNAMIFYLSQSFHKLTPFIRLNTQYFMLFKIVSRDLSNIATFFSAIMDKKVFYEVFRIATNERYNFLLIDLKTEDPNMKVRHNWDRGFVIE